MESSTQSSAVLSKRSVPWSKSLYATIFLGLVILLGVTVFLLRLIINSEGKRYLESQNKQLYTEITSQVLKHLVRETDNAKVLTQSLANTSPFIDKEVDTYKKAFHKLIDHDHLKSVVAGGGIWPEPGAFKAGVDRRSFFWGRNTEGILEYYDDYNDPQSNGYHNEEWYVPSKWLAPDEVFWSKSYMDPYSFQPMVTCTAPIFENGTYRGCSTIDLKLEGLDELTRVDSEKVGGYIFVTDRNNKFLSFPDKEISKIYEGVGDKRSEDFIHAKELAQKFPVFEPIALKLEEVNQNFLKQNRPEPSLIENLDDDSYQINQQEAELIAATLNPKLILPEESLISFEIKNDILLKERCRVYIMFMPNTYWKVVTVIPNSTASHIPSKIADQVSLIAVVIVMFLGVVTLIFLHSKLLSPLKNMTLSLKKFSESDELDYGRLDDRQDNELGVLAHWFNVRSQMLHDSLVKLQQAYRELDVARLKAEDGTRLKNEFMACMSHEIRTPMNAIIGMSQLLEEAELGEEERNYLELLQNSSEHLLAIIDDILDISKLESHQLKIREGNFTLQELVNNVDSILREKAVKKEIEFKILIDSEIPEVLYGDIVRIKQVLINLGDNAIKFTDHGHVHIHLNLLHQIDNKVKLQGKVIDTGIGIKKEDVAKLFQPFSQIDASATRVYEGTGLGLSICKNILDLMHGEISYEGEDGQGSIFVFDFVIEKVVNVIDPSKTSSEVMPIRLNDREPTILLAEDNPDNQLIIERMLEKFGCKYMNAQDGVEAVEKFREGGVDMILMDWQMPNMDGLEATKKIRELEKESGSHVIIVALTANAMGGDREKCLSVGMDDYMSKPFTKVKLKDVLNKYFQS